MILKELRGPAFKDLQTITKITGDKDIRYYDAAYLKERIKGILLSRDPNNIQMLTCFTLQNTIKGLLLLVAEVFGEEIDLKTLLIEPENNQI